jgi:hypothetical protein
MEAPIGALHTRHRIQVELQKMRCQSKRSNFSTTNTSLKYYIVVYYFNCDIIIYCCNYYIVKHCFHY